jgi:dipeptidyl aminopeptidase/acylaminoacyl peptidase
MSEKDYIEEQEDDASQAERVVYTLPGMKQVHAHKNIVYKTVEDLELKLDVYYPAEHHKSERLPAVVLIHGDGPQDYLAHIKDSSQYVSWGQLIAASGLIAVTANHRSSEALHNVAGVANDVDDLISYVRDHHKALQINADSLGIWTCSAGAPFGLRAALYETPPFVNCVVSYYGFTDLKAYYDGLYGESEEELALPPPTFDEDDLAEFSATEHILHRASNSAPIFIARAGLDYPILNQALDSFIAEALAQNIEITIMNHPTGQHGFDTRDNDARSREIIKATLEFMQMHLIQ